MRWINKNSLQSYKHRLNLKTYKYFFTVLNSSTTATTDLNYLKTISYLLNIVFAYYLPTKTVCLVHQKNTTQLTGTHSL